MDPIMGGGDGAPARNSSTASDGRQVSAEFGTGMVDGMGGNEGGGMGMMPSASSAKTRKRGMHPDPDEHKSKHMYTDKERRQSHNEAEKRRQKRISEMINELKTYMEQLGKEVRAGKAQILSASLEHMKQLTMDVVALNAEVAKLKKSAGRVSASDMQPFLSSLDGRGPPFGTSEKMSLKRQAWNMHRLENSPSDLFIEFSQSGTLTYVSGACRVLTGYDPEDLVQTNFLQYLHQADASRARDGLKKWSQYRRNTKTNTDGSRAFDHDDRQPPPTIHYRRMCNTKQAANPSAVQPFVWVQANLHSVTKGPDGTLFMLISERHVPEYVLEEERGGCFGVTTGGVDKIRGKGRTGRS